MKTNYLLAAILCCLTPLLHAQTALSGKVVSADTNEPLAGGKYPRRQQSDGMHHQRKRRIYHRQSARRTTHAALLYIGFTPKKYTADGQEENILVKLEESYSNLSQVVVTGTGTHRRMTDSPRSRIRNHGQRNRQRQRIYAGRSAGEADAQYLFLHQRHGTTMSLRTASTRTTY